MTGQGAYDLIPVYGGQNHTPLTVAGLPYRGLYFKAMCSVIGAIGAESCSGIAEATPAGLILKPAAETAYCLHVAPSERYFHGEQVT